MAIGRLWRAIEAKDPGLDDGEDDLFYKVETCIVVSSSYGLPLHFETDGEWISPEFPYLKEAEKWVNDNGWYQEKDEGNGEPRWFRSGAVWKKKVPIAEIKDPGLDDIGQGANHLDMFADNMVETCVLRVRMGLKVEAWFEVDGTAISPSFVGVHKAEAWTKENGWRASVNNKGSAWNDGAVWIRDKRVDEAWDDDLTIDMGRWGTIKAAVDVFSLSTWQRPSKFKISVLNAMKKAGLNVDNARANYAYLVVRYGTIMKVASPFFKTFVDLDEWAKDNGWKRAERGLERYEKYVGNGDAGIKEWFDQLDYSEPVDDQIREAWDDDETASMFVKVSATVASTNYSEDRLGYHPGNKAWLRYVVSMSDNEEFHPTKFWYLSVSRGSIRKLASPVFTDRDTLALWCMRNGWKYDEGGYNKDATYKNENEWFDSLGEGVDYDEELVKELTTEGWDDEQTKNMFIDVYAMKTERFVGDLDVLDGWFFDKKDIVSKADEEIGESTKIWCLSTGMDEIKKLVSPLFSDEQMFELWCRHNGWRSVSHYHYKKAVPYKTFGEWFASLDEEELKENWDDEQTDDLFLKVEATIYDVWPQRLWNTQKKGQITPTDDFVLRSMMEQPGMRVDNMTAGDHFLFVGVFSSNLIRFKILSGFYLSAPRGKDQLRRKLERDGWSLVRGDHWDNGATICKSVTSRTFDEWFDSLDVKEAITEAWDDEETLTMLPTVRCFIDFVDPEGHSQFGGWSSFKAKAAREMGVRDSVYFAYAVMDDEGGQRNKIISPFFNHQEKVAQWLSKDGWKFDKSRSYLKTIAGSKEEWFDSLEGVEFRDPMMTTEAWEDDEDSMFSFVVLQLDETPFGYCFSKLGALEPKTIFQSLEGVSQMFATKEEALAWVSRFNPQQQAGYPYRFKINKADGGGLKRYRFMYGRVKKIRETYHFVIERDRGEEKSPDFDDIHDLEKWLAEDGWVSIGGSPDPGSSYRRWEPFADVVVWSISEAWEDDETDDLFLRVEAEVCIEVPNDSTRNTSSEIAQFIIARMTEAGISLTDDRRFACLAAFDNKFKRFKIISPFFVDDAVFGYTDKSCEINNWLYRNGWIIKKGSAIRDGTVVVSSVPFGTHDEWFDSLDVEVIRIDEAGPPIEGFDDEFSEAKDSDDEDRTIDFLADEEVAYAWHGGMTSRQQHYLYVGHSVQNKISPVFADWRSFDDWCEANGWTIDRAGFSGRDKYVRKRKVMDEAFGSSRKRAVNLGMEEWVKEIAASIMGSSAMFEYQIKPLLKSIERDEPNDHDAAWLEIARSGIYAYKRDHGPIDDQMLDEESFVALVAERVRELAENEDLSEALRDPGEVSCPLHENPDHAANDLALYVINTGEIYLEETTPIIVNHARKIRRGELTAVDKLDWIELAKRGAQRYVVEFAEQIALDNPDCTELPWTTLFPRAVIEAAAAEIEMHYKEQIEDAVGKIKRVAENDEVDPMIAKLRDRLNSIVNEDIDHKELASDPEVQEEFSRFSNMNFKQFADFLFKNRKDINKLFPKTLAKLAEARIVDTNAASIEEDKIQLDKQEFDKLLNDIRVDIVNTNKIPNRATLKKMAFDLWNKLRNKLRNRKPNKAQVAESFGLDLTIMIGALILWTLFCGFVAYMWSSKSDGDNDA